MNCRHAAELLPWYLNGTLDAAERNDLERHLEGCDACRADLDEAEAAQLLFGGHPPVEMLIEYASGEAGPARELIEAHLAGCESCAEELAMLLASRAAVDDAAAASSR